MVKLILREFCRNAEDDTVMKKPRTKRLQAGVRYFLTPNTEEVEEISACTLLHFIVQYLFLNVECYLKKMRCCPFDLSLTFTN